MYPYLSTLDGLIRLISFVPKLDSINGSVWSADLSGPSRSLNKLSSSIFDAMTSSWLAEEGENGS